MTTTFTTIETPDSLLRYYSALETASHEMLQAARDGDWDNVCRLEGACAVVIAKLRKLSEQQSLTAAEQGERMRILRTIVANDAAIRRICQPLPAMLDSQSFRMEEASATLH